MTEENRKGAKNVFFLRQFFIDGTVRRKRPLPVSLSRSKDCIFLLPWRKRRFLGSRHSEVVIKSSLQPKLVLITRKFLYRKFLYRSSSDWGTAMENSLQPKGGSYIEEVLISSSSSNKPVFTNNFRNSNYCSCSNVDLFIP